MSELRTLRRQEQLLAILAENGEATVEKLAAQLSVSIWTIRRDLNMLEEMGALRRLHGRAEVVDTAVGAQAWDSTVLQQAAVANREAKQQIGCAVAQRLPPGSHIVLSGGSSTLEVAHALKLLHWQGEVVTNSLDIAIELTESPGLRVVCTGGDVQPRYHTLAGPIMERMLRLYYFDYAVIGVSGISVPQGFTVNSQVEAAIANLIADHARTVIVLADQTKFGRVAFAAVLHETPPQWLATNGPVPKELAHYFQELGTEIIYD